MQGGSTNNTGLDEKLAEINACMHTHPERALGLCEQTISEAVRLRKPSVHIKAAERYGRIMDHLGRGLEAHDTLFAAQQVAQSARLPDGEAMLLEKIARGYYTAGQYRPAHQYWTRCAELAEQSGGDVFTWILAKIGLAQVYYGLWDWSAGLALLSQAYDKVHHIEDPYLDAKIKINLGVGYMETGLLDDAGSVFQQAKTLCAKHELYDYQAESDFRLAQVSIAKGQLGEAMTSLGEGLSSARKVNYRWCEAHILATLAEVYSRQSDFPKAMEAVKEAQLIAAADGFTHMLVQQHLAAARFAEAMGDAATALDEFKLARAYEMSLHRDSSSERHAKLEEEAGMRPDASRLLVELSNNPLIEEGELGSAFRLIIREGCRILGVSRGALWMLAQECSVLACHWLFDAVRDDYAEQAPLHRSASPAFFSRLLDSTALVAHDAAHHTYTWELESAYLKPHDIRSMLVFPIRVAGHTCAALCFEVTGVQRNWTPDDIANGNQLAEISARVLASHERRLFQNEISELNSRLLDTNEALEARVMERTAALEQRNAELVELNTQLSNMQNQLLQSEKMASIGQLSAGVAHEINNPIGYVYSNISSLEKYLDDLMAMLARYEASESLLPAEERTRLNEFKIECDLEYLREDLPQLMKESREGITRVKKIVMDLRDFSHADTGEMGIHDLNAGLQSTLNLVNNELQKKAKVICEFGELPPVECMLARLNQVFLNLLVNAGHALEGRQGGEIRVRTGCDGEEVSISISDNGCGIKPENMKKIFDAFFTTKPIGRGTGLGLSLSYSIMQAHHGNIDVESELDKGTTFTLRLPVKQPADDAEVK